MGLGTCQRFLLINSVPFDRSDGSRILVNRDWTLMVLSEDETSVHGQTREGGRSGTLGRVGGSSLSLLLIGPRNRQVFLPRERESLP